MDGFTELLSALKFGKENALTADQLYEKSTKKISLGTFRRNLRFAAEEARKMGHRIIGDDNGYYIALNEGEWEAYRVRRFAAIKNELVSLAAPEGISVQDLIKLVYKVKVEDKNLSLNL